jgi:hypothetical protein
MLYLEHLTGLSGLSQLQKLKRETKERFVSFCEEKWSADKTNLGISDQQIITHNFNFLTQGCCELGEMLPVILVKGVLNQDNWIFFYEGLIQLHKLLTSDLATPIIVLHNQ